MEYGGLKSATSQPQRQVNSGASDKGTQNSDTSNALALPGTVLFFPAMSGFLAPVMVA